MKKLLKSLEAMGWCLFLALALTACGPAADNEVKDTSIEQVGWEMGQPKMQMYYIIETTISQGYHFAFKSGYTLQLIIGLFLIAFGCYATYRKAIDKGIGEKVKPLGIIYFLMLFAIFAGGIAFIHGKPFLIAGEKYRVTRESYDYHMEKEGSTQPLIDSIYQANHLLSAPVK